MTILRRWSLESVLDFFCSWMHRVCTLKKTMRNPNEKSKFILQNVTHLETARIHYWLPWKYGKIEKKLLLTWFMNCKFRNQITICFYLFREYLWFMELSGKMLTTIVSLSTTSLICFAHDIHNYFWGLIDQR